MLVKLLRVLATIIALAAAAASGVVLSVGQPETNQNVALWGISLAAGAVVLQALLATDQLRTQRRSHALATQYQLILTRTMSPVMRIISRMGDQTPGQRKYSLREASTQIVNSVVLILGRTHIDARATAYLLNEDGTKAVMLTNFGGAFDPESFDFNTERGAKAMAALTRTSHLIRDVAGTATAWTEVDADYNGRIVAPIRVGTKVYGLLTYEVRDGKRLTEDDQHVVDVFAEAAAAAIALAQPEVAIYAQGR
jgi:putative methionine-R-sulfoxide reductase with GAF domain